MEWVGRKRGRDSMKDGVCEREESGMEVRRERKGREEIWNDTYMRDVVKGCCMHGSSSSDASFL